MTTHAAAKSGAGAAGAAALALTAQTLRSIARAAAGEWEQAGGAAAQADALARRAEALAVENAEAFAQATEALDHRTEIHVVVLGNRLAAAADVPGRVCAAACDVAELAAQMAQSGPVGRRADAAACAALADGVAGAASVLVGVNLAVTATDERRQAVDATVARAQQARAAALATLADELS